MEVINTRIVPLLVPVPLFAASPRLSSLLKSAQKALIYRFFSALYAAVKGQLVVP